ncbi:MULTISPECIES: hypothetical protein [unclassified Streptomyces]|uniref:hypothetical protein n=1 Tax=unclassified Streptomyces TaxID=2593676 RepID=UPI002E17C672|nr:MULTISPECIES: hypothetical protein [unclassified Streptomyces]
MLTIVIVAVIVIAASAVLFVGRKRARGTGGHSLKHRFGPEYARAVSLHDGDVQAAERELTERVKRHGSLKQAPLPPEDRAHYRAQWTAIQEEFVDSPHKAVTEADALLARLAQVRGFPDGARFEEQHAALSVHHAEHLHGYRSMHTVVRGRSGTEEMREAMVEARGLFEALVTEQPADSDDRHHQAKESGTP